MIKKTLLIAALALSATSLWAQEELQPYPYKWGAGIELGYGTALDVSVRGQYYINKHLTWDAFQVRAIQNFNNTVDANKYLNSSAITTGLRAYTPTFGPSLKGFAAAGVGWGYYWTTNKFFSTVWSDSASKTTHNLAADFSAGIFIGKGFYLSYACQLLHNGSRGNLVNHFVNLGFEIGSLRLKNWKE